MQDWLTTIASVTIGGLIAAVSTWFNDGRITKRGRERRKEERNERLIARNNEFQRETLLALQVASQKLIRNAGASLHQDIVAHRTTGKWHKQPLPNGLSDEQMELTTQVMLLANRVRDDQVRQLVDEFRIRLNHVFQTSGEVESEFMLLSAGSIQGPLLDQIGQILRDLDSADKDISSL
ncbi:hypothetical protein [Sandarakinorhabdus sp.]|uniref:hypothetical protein n=1 Tax=Sandarakinorhabdus sp. TaxID=1916663 RepID=UPI00333EDCFD